MLLSNSYTAQSSLSQGRELDRVASKLDRAQGNVTSAERDLRNFLGALGETWGRWVEGWKAFCDEAQDLEEERIDFIKDVCWAYANSVSSVCVVDDEVRATPPKLTPGSRSLTTLLSRRLARGCVSRWRPSSPSSSRNTSSEPTLPPPRSPTRPSLSTTARASEIPRRLPSRRLGSSGGASDLRPSPLVRLLNSRPSSITSSRTLRRGRPNLLSRSARLRGRWRNWRFRRLHRRRRSPPSRTVDPSKHPPQQLPSPLLQPLRSSSSLLLLLLRPHPLLRLSLLPPQRLLLSKDPLPSCRRASCRPLPTLRKAPFLPRPGHSQPLLQHLPSRLPGPPRIRSPKRSQTCRPNACPARAASGARPAATRKP